MFDTHAHLNFKRFKKNVNDVITRAKEAGVEYIVIPGTDLKTSQKAVEIAEEYDGVYAAVGIHPHHVFELIENDELRITNEIEQIEKLLSHPKVVSVGEIGMDKHVYGETKYEKYNIDQKFLQLQQKLLQLQLKLAKLHKKSLILHNREAKDDLLELLNQNWDSSFENKAVFHCCEPDAELLSFAKDHKMFIGVDGDITYYTEKQAFIKEVPLEMIVLETDSPFLLPEPLKSKKLYPNEPKNIPVIAEFIAKLKGIEVEDLKIQTTENAKVLFRI